MISGGFDIIVANPPYVRMELIKPLKPKLRRNFAAVHDERTDLYIYFYARAHELLRPGGVAAFISPNKWLRAGYGEKLRQLLLDAQAFHLVADFGELPVFQTAATFPAIGQSGQAKAIALDHFERRRTAQLPQSDLVLADTAKRCRRPR